MRGDWISGLVVGVVLSALRAPLGIDLARIPAVDAAAAYGWRALALALVAFAWRLKRDGAVSIAFLASTAVAFAAHALWLSAYWTPTNALQLWITALAGFAALLMLGRGDVSLERKSAVEPTLVHMIGACASGAGIALALESLARHVRLLGGGLAQDDSVSASVLLVSIAVGAAACGWIATSARLRGVSFPVACAAAAAASFAGLGVLARVASTRGLERYLAAYGLDATSHGTLAYDALLAASCFALPGLLLGAALRASRSKLELSSALIGAALGLYFVPGLLKTAERSAGQMEIFSSHLVPYGCLVAIGGAALALLADDSITLRARWSAIACALCLGLVPLNADATPTLIVSPWMTVPPKQFLVFDSPEGLVTVEPSDGGLAMATLDRRPLTPPTSLAVADMERIKLSIAMLPSAPRADRAPRVLLVGQRTPVRAQAFKDAGVASVDCTAAWFASMQRIESVLFEKVEPPLGERLPPAEATRRIDAGEYDLVIVAPVPGDAPFTSRLAVPEKTTLVAWFSADEWIAERELGGSVLYWSDGVDDPCVGVVVHGAAAPRVDGEPPVIVAAGEPVCAPSPLARLSMRECARSEERTNWCRASLARRLAGASRGGAHEKLMHGFASLYAAQASSPDFESADERIELPDDALAAFEQSALEAPSALTRGLWESLARVLLGKRDVGNIYKYLQPLAQKHAPWPVLEQVLAQADLEALEPAAAARRLSALIEARARTNDGVDSVTGGDTNAGGAASKGKDLELWYWLGEAQRRAGDHASAVRSFRRAHELQPENRALERELAMELVRAGDPDGRVLVESLLAKSPGDDELAAYLEPGPYPEPAPNNWKKSSGAKKKP